MLARGLGAGTHGGAAMPRHLFITGSQVVMTIRPVRWLLVVAGQKCSATASLLGYHVSGQGHLGLPVRFDFVFLGHVLHTW